MKEAEAQLESHNKICPEKVEKPVLLEQVRNEYEQLKSEITQLSEEIERVENRIIAKNKETNTLLRHLDVIDEFENRVNIEKRKIELQLNEFNIDIDDIIKIEINKNPIMIWKEAIDNELNRDTLKLNDKNIGLKNQLLKKQTNKIKY